MLTNEQLRALKERVEMAVNRIKALHAENRELKEKNRAYEQRIAELESHFSSIQEGQNEMERGILSALDSLDQLEDDFSGSDRPTGSTNSNHNPITDDINT